MKLNQKMRDMLSAKGFNYNESRHEYSKQIFSWDKKYIVGEIHLDSWGDEIIHHAYWKQVASCLCIPTLEKVISIMNDVESELDRLWLE